MLKLYSKAAAERILRRYEPWIDEVAARYALPSPFIKAFLYREITEIDLLDLAADLAVRVNWLVYPLTGGSARRRIGAESRRGLLGRLDSSTGYAQIFAFVAINAVGFALDRGLADHESLGVDPAHRPDSGDPDDLREMWRRLNRDRKFNMEAAALNLIAAAEETTGRIDFGGYSADEIKRIFTRYNGTANHITAYGEEAYRHYLRYAAEM